jgi:hypothetical protein
MGRVNFSVIFAKYNKIGKGNVRLTQSTLILSKPIVPTVATYNFDVLETQTATLQNNEIRLNLNDEFIVTTMGLYLQASVERITEAGVATASGSVLFPYIPTEQTSNLASLNDIYNGTLQIAVNNIVYLDKWDTRKHESRPRTQYTQFTTPNSATQGSTEFNKSAMFPVEPLLTLSGAKKNNIQLALANAISSSGFTHKVDDGSTVRYTFDRIALVMRGLNAQNGASFQN